MTGVVGRIVRSRTARCATASFVPLPPRHRPASIASMGPIHRCSRVRQRVETAPSRPAGRKALGYCLSRRRSGFDSRRLEHALRPWLTESADRSADVRWSTIPQPGTMSASRRGIGAGRWHWVIHNLEGLGSNPGGGDVVAQSASTRLHPVRTHVRATLPTRSARADAIGLVGPGFDPRRRRRRSSAVERQSRGDTRSPGPVHARADFLGRCSAGDGRRPRPGVSSRSWRVMSITERHPRPPGMGGLGTWRPAHAPLQALT